MNEATGPEMDAIDRRLLDTLQEEFPLAAAPFAEIAKRAGLTEDEARKRVATLKARGYIRRIGAVIDAKKLGYSSLLCAASVRSDIIDKLAHTLNSNPSVTHNYEREGTLNLWFTVTMKTQSDIDRFLKNIEDAFSIRIYRFPEKRTFKIKTHFMTSEEK